MATAPAFLLYEQVDPSKKDAAWGNLCISRLRMDWRCIISVPRSRINKSYLLGVQDMEKIKKSFKDKHFIKNTEFVPIDVMFSIRNTLTEDLLKAAPKAELKATDPTAISDREKDIQMLKSRKIIEGDINKYQKQIGIPDTVKYKLPYDKYKGNVQEFDNMGLDEDDPDDVNFYKLNFQRLAYEIAGQQVVNNVMKLNRFDEDMIKKFVIDYLANKVITAQTYVDKITGEIKYQYIYPECAYGIFNDWNDGHNDICKGWQDGKTVGEFLQMAGNDFEWNRDWTKLLWSINYANNAKFTGFKRSQITYSALGNEQFINQGVGLGPTENGRDSIFDSSWPELLIDWTLAYTYKVQMGYIEWNTCEATNTALYKTPPDLEHRPETLVGFVPYNFELEGKEQIEQYQKVSSYQQQWYKSYFLQTSSIGQWIFDYGKVYYQQLEGANDEYSSGTLKYYINEGQSAVEVARPFIDFVNFAYYKTLWVVYHAKPEEDQVVLEELIAISKGFQRLYPQDNKLATPSLENMLNQLIKYQRENFLRVRSFPQIDGRSIGQLPQLEGKRNGIDNIGQEMISIMQWAENQIANKLGINAMRLGANPQSRESYKSEQATLESSLNTTGDIYRTVQFLKQRMATTTLLYAQDILRFKDSIPYKWLMRLVGNEIFASLDVLDNVASHRFGIFFGDYNTDINKNNILQAANMALQQKLINIDGWAMITQTEDVKLAFKLLSYLEKKKEKKLRKQQLEDKKIEDQMDQNKFNREKELEQVKTNGAKERAQIAEDSAVKVAQINTQGKIDVKNITIKSEPEKAAAKTQTNVETAHAKADAESQKSFPSATGG